MKRVALALLLLLQACSAMPQPTDAGRAESQTIIFVARRGWHIDVGFSTPDIGAPLRPAVDDFPGSRYLFFGFGDKHYLAAKHKDFPGLLAALWPGPGMMLTTALAAAPEEAFGTVHVVRLRIDKAQASAAQTFIWNSLRTADGVPERYGNGPYSGSLFFGAVPKYSAVYTCNTWAAQVLQAAGVPVHRIGVIFASQLWSQVRRIDSARRAPISARRAPFDPLALVQKTANGHVHD